MRISCRRVGDVGVESFGAGKPGEKHQSVNQPYDIERHRGDQNTAAPNDHKVDTPKE